MDIIYLPGDMFAGKQNVFLHGCNAQGVMGSGVARQIVEQYTPAYKAYRQAYETSGLKLGQVVASIAERNGEKIVIFNCITQNKYGRGGVRYVNYGAIAECIRKVDLWMSDQRPGQEVAMPMIGAGLGGGDWCIISKIIEQNSRAFQPVVYDWTL